MSKRLPVVIVLLVSVSIGFAVLIAKELTRAPRVTMPRPQPAASVGTVPPASAPAAPTAPEANYTMVATRNLFSPTRTEAPPAPPAPAPAAPPPPPQPKPNLFGVVLQEATPIAYLEDPMTKRVARYRVGDSVAGGTVQAIGPDTVTLARPEGQVIVRLHDPTRPRPAMPATPTPTPPTPVPGPALVPPPGTLPGGTPTQFRRPGALGRIPPQPSNAPSP